ncbi:DNA-directed DNA polymerase [Tanacetum coccineum]
MNERCSAVLLNKLPSKEKDPGSFTIPCDIGHLHIDNDLAYLGASISLIPYTMYKKLGLGEPKPTRMSLELVDKSIQYPRGIAEDVLIKIDKFVLPIDFVLLDMRKDSRILIILGRPFLATTRAMIGVFNKKISLRIGSEEVIFDVDQSMKKPHMEDDECYGIDDLYTVIQSAAQELLENKNLEDDIIVQQEVDASMSEPGNKVCTGSAVYGLLPLAATWDDHTINGGTLVLLVYLVNAAKVNSCLVLGWDKDSIKLKKAIFGFIEDVIMKTIDYHVFDVVVEFHREIHDLNFRGSSCKNLFVLSSSNRGRLLGFTDLMRQKNKRMKQEGLIQHYGILEDLKSNSSYLLI